MWSAWRSRLFSAYKNERTFIRILSKNAALSRSKIASQTQNVEGRGEKGVIEQEAAR
jgi:hypothetical protein